MVEAKAKVISVSNRS